MKEKTVLLNIVGVLLTTVVMVSGVRAQTVEEDSVRALSGEWEKLRRLAANARNETGGSVVAQTREVSSQETYFNLIEENSALKEERDKAKAEAEKLQIQNSAFLGRTRELESRVHALSGNLDNAKIELEKERMVGEERMARLKEELSAALKRVEDAEKRVEDEKKRSDEQDYIRRYNDARKQLEGARRALSDMSKERAQEIKETEKKMKDLVKENEELKTNIGKAHFNLGTLMFKKGDYEKAAYEFEQALKVLPNDPDVFYNLAIIYDFYIDEPEKAKGFYEDYFRVEPNPGRKKQLKERVAEKQLVSLMNEYQIE